MNTVGLCHSWREFIENEMEKEYFQRLETIITEMRRDPYNTVYPSEDEVFSFAKFCEIEEVKVVILGQDPYPNENQAHGLCFSVKVQDGPLPPSLRNILKEVQNSYPYISVPFHGNLTFWAKQGVLLLNTVLTVSKNVANSHRNIGWEIFTRKIILHISETNNRVVFMLWGRFAQKMGRYIDKFVGRFEPTRSDSQDLRIGSTTSQLSRLSLFASALHKKERHRVLHASHPSPRIVNRGGDFIGCRHFLLANKWLNEKGKSPIFWGENEYNASMVFHSFHNAVMLHSFHNMLHPFNNMTNSLQNMLLPPQNILPPPHNVLHSFDNMLLSFDNMLQSFYYMLYPFQNNHYSFHNIPLFQNILYSFNNMLQSFHDILNSFYDRLPLFQHNILDSFHNMLHSFQNRLHSFQNRLHSSQNMPYSFHNNLHSFHDRLHSFHNRLTSSTIFTTSPLVPALYSPSLIPQYSPIFPQYSPPVTQYSPLVSRYSPLVSNVHH